ncbi:MAG: class I SAM-dependent methyltransferase, partial [Blastocatellia bacterium]|nr:class I SAM-dependent methyltransferase [Blastocatellia bacterium]
MARDLGDFQTPASLVTQVLDCLGPVGERWPNVLEPTCGSGSFIRGLIESRSPPREIQGFEIQDLHLARASRIAESSKLTKVSVQKANIFNLDLKRDIKWRETGPLLVIGNPPWITNSELGVLRSANLPPKSNLKKLAGLDALTGSSNFDIAEFIWLKLIEELADQNPAIALLSKTSVARNVLQFACDRRLPISSAWVRRIDARKHFDAAVDACLFYVEVSAGESLCEIPVFENLRSSEPETVWGFSEGRLVVDIDAHRRTAFIDGLCPLTWRQGVKHDAAQVMELKTDGEVYRNKLGETVDVEEDYIYPLLKSRDLHNTDNGRSRLSVIIPQRRIGEDTRELERLAPKLWNYLSDHSHVFARRKSSIYRGRPRFSIFGIGDYSFAPFKVAVSGFYKDPRFRV